MTLQDRDFYERKQAAAGCPWCGDGTELILRGDGFGGMSLWCSKCACKGPTVPIEEAFENADGAAIHQWSKRAARQPDLPQEVIDRVSRSVALASVLRVGSLSDTAEVSLQVRDVSALMKLAVPDWRIGPP